MCGWASACYFTKDWEDHQITEWWDGTRWVRADVQVGPLAANVLDLAFDPADQPPGQFLTAAEAWRECRTGNEDPARFGIFDLRGLDFISGSIAQDLAGVEQDRTAALGRLVEARARGSTMRSQNS